MSYIYNEGVEMIQKVLFLFRASPYASVCVGRYLESMLSDIPRHPPSASAWWQAEKPQIQKVRLWR